MENDEIDAELELAIMGYDRRDKYPEWSNSAMREAYRAGYEDGVLANQSPEKSTGVEAPVGWAVLAKRPDRAGTAFEHDFASSLHRTLNGAETSQMIATDKTEDGCDKFGHPVEYVLAEVRVIPGGD